MGKRSDFERIPRDFYPTPAEAVDPLLSHLKPNTRFCEPCAGDGALIRALENKGHECTWACDVDPKGLGIFTGNALDITSVAADCFITNPPWDRKILHPIIQTLAEIRPTWLLFDADWMHTKQSVAYLPFLKKIVSVGRIKWMPNSKMTGKDNCCWYLFSESTLGKPEFFGRTL